MDGRRLLGRVAKGDREAFHAFYDRYAPGSAFPRHRHIGLEENVILVGGYESGGVRADAGDWVICAPGSEEMPRTEVDEECWCLSRIEPPGVELIGLGR